MKAEVHTALIAFYIFCLQLGSTSTWKRLLHDGNIVIVRKSCLIGAIPLCDSKININW
jgi:hypothetical protein